MIFVAPCITCLQSRRASLVLGFEAKHNIRVSIFFIVVNFDEKKKTFFKYYTPMKTYEIRVRTRILFIIITRPKHYYYYYYYYYTYIYNLLTKTKKSCVLYPCARTKKIPSLEHHVPFDSRDQWTSRSAHV